MSLCRGILFLETDLDLARFQGHVPNTDTQLFRKSAEAVGSGHDSVRGELKERFKSLSGQLGKNSLNIEAAPQQYCLFHARRHQHQRYQQASHSVKSHADANIMFHILEPEEKDRLNYH